MGDAFPMGLLRWKPEGFSLFLNDRPGNFNGVKRICRPIRQISPPLKISFVIKVGRAVFFKRNGFPAPCGRSLQGERRIEVMARQEDRGWSPYLAGALSGVVSVLSVWFVGQYFGASTSFVRFAGALEKIFAPERVQGLEYFVKTPPVVDWQWMFVVGILLGSLIASTTSGSFRWQAVPTMWEKRFGPGIPKRALAAFIGGVISIFGARLADG
jgi:hypothetical protein